MKFIFVVGGSISSLGKGIFSSSLASLLQEYGYKVRIRKLDPYLNVDAGTMNPAEHGEVFVTCDGAEADLDLGYYERHTSLRLTSQDTITSGKIYSSVINQERAGDYKGKTVQFIPHVTNEIQHMIKQGLQNEDFVICEIGGTVGDMEINPFLEAVRQFRSKNKGEVCLIHLAYIPYLPKSDEIKTKLAQNSFKHLLSLGLKTDILICRGMRALEKENIAKLEMYCDLEQDMIISLPDQEVVFQVPLVLEKERLIQNIERFFQMPEKKRLLAKSNWEKINDLVNNTSKTVRIAIVAKYVLNKDSYKSLEDVLNHAGIHQGIEVITTHVVAQDLEKINDEEFTKILKNFDAIIVPGGYGYTGVEGKLRTIKYARENNIPFFGICYGMQLSVIEGYRNLLNQKNATSEELSEQQNTNNIVEFIEEWQEKGKTYFGSRQDEKIGGTSRLGEHSIVISGAESDSIIQRVYDSENVIKERHRHRFGVKVSKIKALAEFGYVVTGHSEDKNLVEVLEIKGHRWFLGVQYHPEFNSTLFKPSKIFMSFVQEAGKNK